MAGDTGFDNTGIDLIAGLPGVSPDEWLQTLECAVSLGLKHLSVYALSLEPGTLLSQRASQGLTIPDDDAQLAALEQAERVLSPAGFVRYELSNYALPGFECRHNLGVWRGNDYLGLGPAAASRIGYRRWTNTEDLADYIEALAENREPPRTREQLSAGDDAVERRGIAERGGRRWRLTERGREVCDAAIRELL
jgi:oxygen-independent coproporphyrinogen-3 oxidase